MFKLILSFFLILNFLAFANPEWMIEAQQPDQEAIKWLKDHLKERLNDNFLKNPLAEERTKSSCIGCMHENLILDEALPLYVFMSFYLEDILWLQFSKELEKTGGTFVIRGLPENSFKLLANRLFDLQQKGVNVPIQIHPKLFEECDVKRVPTIAFIEGSVYDKLEGNISLKYALETMSIHGETKQAKKLLEKL